MALHQFPSISLAGVVLVAAAGCAPAVRSERDAAIPVPRGATWAWETQASGPDTGRWIRQTPGGAVDPIVQQRFRRAIDAVMDAKGFRRVEAEAQPDFVLSYHFAASDYGYARHPGGGTAAMGFGWYGGWGWAPSFGPFFPRWGFYRPWGFAPWGWGGWYGAPAWSFAVVPTYGEPYHTYGGYGETGLVVTLRLRSTGDVAFEGRYHTSLYEARRMSQEKVQDIVGKMLEKLG